MADVQIQIQDALFGDKAGKVVRFAGQLDETNVDEEAKKIYQVVDQSELPYIMLDFGELTYMNSKSIGYLTDWYTRIAEKGGMIVVAQPQPNILDILKVVGITQIVSVYETIEAASQALAAGAVNPAS
ncbi:STAS domain-containing protein [Candidatus Peregrinibacteria bacterium]|nr:MAG: STAS domain-containing protein [Candidatus Peregrinibacteria bacterium]